MNLLAIFVAALIPMVIGFIYYHKNVVGNAWMSVTGMTEEKARESNMVVILIISYVLAVFLATALSQIVIHQNGLLSLFGGETTDPLYQQVVAAKADAFRTLGHGMLHGFMTSLFVGLPLLATNALFEQKGWKYIWINVGYWAVTLTLMGGLLCAWV